MIHTPEYILFDHPIAGEIHWYPRTQNKLTWHGGNYCGDGLKDGYVFVETLP